MEPFKMKQDEHFIIERKSIELLIAAPETCRFWWHDPCSFENRKLFVMRTGTTILLVAVLALGSIASLPRLCAEGPDGSVPAEPRDGSSCADRYNALLGQAKASLVKGDRGAAINSLLMAKIQLHTCQELEERNSTAAVAVALKSAQSVCIE
jgi:hypothetical protein